MRGTTRLLIATATVLGSLVAGPVPAVPASPAPAAETGALINQGPVTLVSTNDTGQKGDQGSSEPDLSPGGTTLAFLSGATNFDAGDTDTLGDIFTKDLSSGEVTLASTSDTGVKSTGRSSGPSIDGSGTTVAFESLGANLDPADADGLMDIYVKDLATGDLTLASTTATGTKGNDASSLPSLSKGAGKVAFETLATNLDPTDTDDVSDVYVKNLRTGDLQLVSTTSAGAKQNFLMSFNAQLSQNAKRVAFDSVARLDPADTDAHLDIYVKELGSGTTILASTSDAGVKGNSESWQASVSTTGRKVAFASIATNLDPADADSAFDIFVKDLDTGDLVLASTSDGGVKANGLSLDPVLSPSGTRVAFYSLATNLDPADTTDDADYYEKDLITGDISLISTSSDGIKADGSNIGRPTLSGRGARVVFSLDATNLDPGDTDTRIDLFMKEPFLCTVTGTPRRDILTGTSGPDVICGRKGRDTIDAVGGNDVVVGEGGDDVITGGSGADRLDGGGGTDLIDYSTSGGGVQIDLSAGTALGGDADGDVYAGFENAQGSNLIDVLTGDGGDNGLIGLDGDDILVGGGGADVLWGADGVDVIDYQTSPSAVTVDLAAGTASGGDADGDLILTDEGVIGSAFDDTLTGDAGDNVFVGMAGADAVDGGAGTDLANYLFSSVGVTVNLTNGTIKGGDAEGDTLTGIENLGGSAFDDKLVGNDDPNTLTGLDGDDFLNGGGGDDHLIGGAGTDEFDGGGGTDTCDDVAGETVTQCEL